MSTKYALCKNFFLGFYPRFPPFWTTKTHSDITNAGTLQAVSEYIFRHKMNATSPSTALDDFFGTGMTIVYFLLTSKKKLTLYC
jgi:hypothetical protein